MSYLLKNYHYFDFENLCLEDLRICFCLNKRKPWLELFFKFNQSVNQCSMTEHDIFPENIGRV